MALVLSKFCNKCGSDTRHTNNKCDECSRIDKENAIRNWEALSVERKLTDIRIRLEALELSRNPIRY